MIGFDGDYNLFLDRLKIKGFKDVEYDSDKLQHLYYFLFTLNRAYLDSCDNEKIELNEILSLINKVIIYINVTSEIPIAKGLGSSASYLAALAACLYVNFNSILMII